MGKLKPKLEIVLLKVLEETSMWLKDSHLMAVKTCSKASLAPCSEHGKSPCFLQGAFLQLLGPDYRLLVLPCVDGAEFLECAF